MLKRCVTVTAVLLTFALAGPRAHAQDYGPGVSVRTKSDSRPALSEQTRGEGSREADGYERRDADRAQTGKQIDPRQRFHNGRWWYLTKDNQWLYYENGRWIPHQQAQYYQPQPQYYQGGNYRYEYGPQPYGNRYGSGYRGNYNGGYYGQGYYNGPGYGNRGWGNANYGNRGANQGSNIGGAIGQGLGGSGQIGAGIGAAIGNQ